MQMPQSQDGIMFLKMPEKNVLGAVNDLLYLPDRQIELFRERFKTDAIYPPALHKPPVPLRVNIFVDHSLPFRIWYVVA